MSRAVKGSVTVFLCLILLPMVTYSAMIIDATRLQSVRTNIAGAGDLTLNAALSEYNELLEDMYGLFANCKSEDDLKGALRSYFEQTVEGHLSKVNSDSEYIQRNAQWTAEELTNLALNHNGEVTEDMLTDYLNVQLSDTFACAPVQDTALANPNIMKRQIIEYMKYKGPVSLASGLLEKLDFLKNASTQTESVDNKVKYCEKLGAMHDPCVDAFEAIENYNMGALTMNLLIFDGGVAGFIRKAIGAKTGLEMLIEDSQDNYQKSTVFYLMNAKSPYREESARPNYDTIANQITAKSYDKLNESLNNAAQMPANTYEECQKKEQAFKKVFADLKNGISGMVNLNLEKVNRPGGGDAAFEKNFDTVIYEVQYPEDNDPDKDIDYNKVSVNVTFQKHNDPNSKYPSLGKIDDHENGSWFAPYNRLKNAGALDYETQKNYAKEVLKAQNKLKDEYLDGIKEYIQKSKNIQALAGLYGTALMDYKLFLENMFDAVNDEFEGKIEDVELAKKLLYRTYNYDEYYLTNLEIDAVSNAISTKYPEHIKAFLNTAVQNNELYLKYAYQYNEAGFADISVPAMTLDMMAECLSTASGKLQEILNLMKEMETAKDNWKNSIDHVESDSTRAAMLSDYKTSIDKFQKSDVENLKKIIDNELIPQVKKQSELFGTLKYLGEKIYNKQKASNIFFDYVKGKTDEKASELAKGNFLQRIGGALLNDVMNSKIAYNANQKVFNKLQANETIVAPPDFEKNSIILSTTFEVDKVEETAANLISQHYDTSGFKTSEFKRFRVIDAIIDSKAPSAYDKPDQELYYDTGKLEELGILDKDEKFYITLYSEYEAKKAAEANAGKTDENKSENEQDADTIKDMADQNNKEMKGEVTTAPAASSTKTTTTETEDLGAIMKSIEGYCKQNENNKQETMPAMENADIKKGDEASNSKGGSSLTTAKGMLDGLKDIGTAVVDAVYLEEYFTEMFSCRTDNQYLNSLTAKSDKDVLPVIMLNGYGNKSSGAKKQLNTNTAWYGKEIEYLLWGNSDLNKNLLYTDASIYAIRFALNAIYAFTAPDIQSFALEVATAIAGWTVIGVPIVQACITIVIALAESGYDIYLLHDGRGVPIFKSQATFVCSPAGMLKTVVKEVGHKLTDAAIKAVENKIEEKLDSTIDNLADKAEDKLCDHVDDFESTVTEFTKSQIDSVYTAVRSQFFNPILNQVVSLACVINTGSRYKTATPEAVIDAGIDAAFDEIDASVKTMKDGIVKQVLEKVLASKRDTIKSAVSAKIKEYFEKATGTVSTVKLEDALNKVLDDNLAEFKTIIETEVGKVGDKIKNKISEAKDTTVAGAKSYVNEQLNKASKQISGAVHNKLDDLSDKLPEGSTMDTAGSGGVTLNYKEYCKIFMLVGIAAKQNQMLQRAAVLVEANIRHAQADRQTTFDMTKANTLFSVRAQVEMTTLFPWCVTDNMDESSTETGLEFDFSKIGQNTVTINYCGINGY